jgi:hypothetical protein
MALPMPKLRERQRQAHYRSNCSLRCWHSKRSNRRRRGRRHPRAPLLPTQRPLRRLLGTAVSPAGSPLTSSLTCTPFGRTAAPGPFVTQQPAPSQRARSLERSQQATAPDRPSVDVRDRTALRVGHQRRVWLIGDWADHGVSVPRTPAGVSRRHRGGTGPFLTEVGSFTAEFVPGTARSWSGAPTPCDEAGQQCWSQPQWNHERSSSGRRLACRASHRHCRPLNGAPLG